jgi:hypothetical protein
MDSSLPLRKPVVSCRSGTFSFHTGAPTRSTYGVAFSSLVRLREPACICLHRQSDFWATGILAFDDAQRNVLGSLGPITNGPRFGCELWLAYFTWIGTVHFRTVTFDRSICCCRVLS